MTVETDPLNATSTFAYDAASQITSRVDRPGRIKEFEYDVLGRGVGETWKSAAGATSQLPTLTGKSPADAVKALEGAGFKPTKPEPTPIGPDGKGGWQTFKHPDGSKIDIHYPSGRVARTAPKILGPDGHPINKGQRLGPDGAEIPRNLPHDQHPPETLGGN